MNNSREGPTRVVSRTFGVSAAFGRHALQVAAAGCVALGGACDSDPGHRGRTSTEWIAQLGDTNAAARESAVDALGRVLEIQPESPKVIRALIGALADVDDEVRLGAGAALSTYRVRIDAALPGLLDALRDSAHAHTRAHAAIIIGRYGDAARSTVPDLSDALTDADADVRASAAQALGLIGTSASAAAPRVVALLDDPNSFVRLRAVQSLRNMRVQAAIALTPLARALGDQDAGVRALAANALGALGPTATPALQRLALALEDPETQVRAEAAFALGKIGPTAREALEPLRRLLARDTTRSVAQQVAGAIARIEGRASPIGPK